MRRLITLIVVTAALIGCESTYDVVAPSGERLATCYDGTLQSFCRIEAPVGTVALPGTSVVSGVAQLLMGAGIATMGGAFAAGR